jgi:hypothetical protein
VGEICARSEKLSLPTAIAAVTAAATATAATAAAAAMVTASVQSPFVGRGALDSG